MKRVVGTIIAAVAVMLVGAGTARAAGILPVGDASGILRDATTGLPKPIAGSPVTVSLFQGAVDVTNTWLPEPGQSVTIVVNGLTSPTITLHEPAAVSLASFTGSVNPFLNSTTLTTSAYPGVCTNFGSPTDLSPDFTLGGDVLMASDCGGMAVIIVNGTYTFILPQDSDADGIPDILEALYCAGTAGPTTCVSPTEDADVSGAVAGDGILAFDELRGFVVSLEDPASGVVFTGADGIQRKHIRTHPRQKDLFVHLVNPQCRRALELAGTIGSSLLGGGTTTYATGDALFGNVNTLISGNQIHRLGYVSSATNSTTDQWIDRFASYSPVSGILWNNPAGGTTSTAPADDRQINQNAVYFSVSGGLKFMQKGLRVIECVDDGYNEHTGPGAQTAFAYTFHIANASDLKVTVNGTTKLLTTDYTVSGAGVEPGGTVTFVTAPASGAKVRIERKSLLLGSAGIGSPNAGDNAIVFTQRIADSVNKAVAAGAGKTLAYQTFQGGKWVTPASTPSPVTSSFLIAKAIAFITAMEIGHSTQLTTAFSTTYGYHYAPGSGDNLDQAIYTTISRTANTFRIPTLYGGTDLTTFSLR